MLQDRNSLSNKEKKQVISLIKEGETIPKELLYKMAKDDEDVFLFWNGRNEEVTNAVLPFHSIEYSIEYIDEPRKEVSKNLQLGLFTTDYRSRQLKGWTNKLIWGDNKLILSSLVNGPLREEIEKALKKGSDKVVIEDGNIMKLTKDKSGVLKREVLTKNWTDWIDYWAIDFNYQDKKEIIRIGKNGEAKEVWTGNYIFENEWQPFRTKKNSELELISAPYAYRQANRYKIAIRVVDILGQDTLQTIDIDIR